MCIVYRVARAPRIAFIGSVLALAVIAAGFPATPILASAPPDPPLPSPVIEVSSEPTNQFLPAVAYNWKHDEYLVVWTNALTGGNTTIWGRRVATTGAARSAVFEIAAAPQNTLSESAVAYDPVRDRYLVVWEQEAAPNDWDIYGRFVPWEGPQTALTAFPIVAWPNNQWAPQVVFGRAPEEFLLVWSDVQPTYWRVGGVRIAADSGATVGATLLITHASQHRMNPAAAYNITRNEYLVVYDNGGDVLAQRFGAAGSPLGAELILAGWPSTEVLPSVAVCSTADQYLVSWRSDEGPVGVHGYVRYVDGGGQFPASGGPYRVDPRANTSYAPVVSCGVVAPNETGETYLVAWEAQFGTSPLGIWASFYGVDFTIGAVFDVLFAEDTLNRLSPAVVGGEGGVMVVGGEEGDHSGTIYINTRARIISPYGIALPLVQR